MSSVIIDNMGLEETVQNTTAAFPKAKQKSKPALCSVPGCENKSKLTMTCNLPNSNVIMHSFPSSMYRQLQWANAIGKSDLTKSKHLRVCSLHFTPDCFIMKNNKIRLTQTAVPTIFPEIDLAAYYEKKAKKSGQKKKSRSPAKSLRNSDYDSDGRGYASDGRGYGSDGRGYASDGRDYISDNRNTDYDSDDGNDDYSEGFGEYISQSKISYISTTGKRSNSSQPLKRKRQVDPWGREYFIENDEVQPKSPKSSHFRPSSVYTSGKSIAKKKVKRSVRFENPAQQALRELRELHQGQFSLMSLAPIEIDQTSSFTAPADSEIQDTSQNNESPVKHAKPTVDSSIAADVLQKHVDVLEKKLKEEKDKAVYYKKKSIATELVVKKYKRKNDELNALVAMLKKKVTTPVFYLKDKNITVSFS